MDAEETVLLIIGKTVTGAGGDAGIRLDDGLANLGVDSLAVLTVIMESAELLGADLSALDETAPAPETVQDLVNMLESLLNQRNLALQ